MKNTVWVILIAFAIGSAFTPVSDPAKDILGKWKIEEKSLEKTTRAVISVTRKNNPDLARQMEDNFPAMVEMVANIVVTYKEDHSYEILTPQGPQPGHWELVDNNQSLLLTPEGRPQRKDSILEISSDRLVVINRERGDTTAYIHP
jgi:hypothetical protein